MAILIKVLKLFKKTILAKVYGLKKNIWQKFWNGFDKPP
jgi:hypothetical protein